ncbi:MAG: hypothetical protein KGZ40_06540 [Clostridiales bacterium]|nr:hypothetical protein [Clostridiales bacterium]
MSSAQLRSLVQLVGVTCVAYALYSVWLSFGNLDESIWVGALARQPFTWVGLALMAGPYVVAALVYLRGRSQARSGVLAYASAGPSERTFLCRSCRAPVVASAKVCRACGEFQA